MTFKRVNIFIVSFLGVIFLLVSLAAYSATKEASVKVKTLEDRQTPLISLPDLKKGTLKNKMKYYGLRNKEIPIVKLVAFIKGGSVFDPDGKEGLTSVTAGLMREGGTEDMTPEELDEKLDRMASNISIATGSEVITATLVSSSENFSTTLNIFLDILFKPRFDRERFQLIIQRALASVKRRKDNPETLASIGFTSLLYGKNNPWGSYITTRSIEGITEEDIRNFHKKFFHPSMVIVGISGDFNIKEALKIIKTYKGYPEGELLELAQPAASPSPKDGVHIIDVNKSQAVINAGHQGSVRANPDKYALIVLDDIIGSPISLKSKLATLVRVERGLAYSINSRYTFGPKDAPGIFSIFAATKTESTREVIELMRDELTRMAKGEGIMESNVREAKEAILNRLVFGYASAFDIISQVVYYNYFGYPDNYIEIYGEKIKQVELDDVKRVALKYLHPARMQFVIAGDAYLIRPQLKDYMTEESLTIEE